MSSRPTFVRALLTCLAVAAAPAQAAVNTIATFDEFTFHQETDPYGSGHATGPDYDSGLGHAAASLSATNPNNGPYASQPYDFQGSLHVEAATQEGLNKGRVWIDSQETVLNGDRLVGAMALSSWHERILITGGTGTGTISLTARLDGNITVWGERNVQGLSGRGLAALTFLTAAIPLQADDNPLHMGLAFPCGADEDGCDYDRSVFKTVGGLSVESDESLAYDETTTLTISFEYGVPFYLYGTLEVNAYGFNTGAGAEADFFNTGRISAFQAPTDAIVTLASGRYDAFALPTPVPEPATVLQWLAGMAVLAGAGLCGHRREGPPGPTAE